MLGWMMGILVVMNAIAMVADKNAVVMVVLERERERKACLRWVVGIRFVSRTVALSASLYGVVVGSLGYRTHSLAAINTQDIGQH